MKVGYVRVSTKEQNTIRQEDLMKALKVEKVFIEKASAKDTKRSQLQELLKFIREGDTLIVESISRFARSTKDLLNLLEILKEKNVEFISQKESIDTTTPSGKFMLTVFGAISELERDYIRQRQREGINSMPVNEYGVRYSLRSGKTVGKPRIPFPPNWKEEYTKWKNQKQSAIETMKILNLKRTTFYKKVKEYENL